MDLKFGKLVDIDLQIFFTKVTPVQNMSNIVPLGF